MKIDILGTPYDVLFKDYKDEPLFEKRSIDGFADDVDKLICVCSMKTHPSCKDETEGYCFKIEKGILRHEIIHAFLNESGLRESSLIYDSGWARNEEMVDWMALQLPKIAEACYAVDAM